MYDIFSKQHIKIKHIKLKYINRNNIKLMMYFLKSNV